jgi:two-component system, response regulator PdtaR
MTAKKSVVIVEDQFLIAAYFRQLCVKTGLEVRGISGEADAAFKLISQTRPDYVLMDVRLKGARDGVDVAIAVHGAFPEIKVIFVTGSNEPPMIDRIKLDHPFRILIKPVSDRDLAAALSS